MSESTQCQICYEEYNQADRQPRVIPSCGHTLCLHCLKKILNRKTCPFDKQIKGDETSFPINHALLDVIEWKKKNTICNEHNKPHEFYCLCHSAKICIYCALTGSHKGHNIESLEEIEKKIQKSLESLENLSRQVMKFEQGAKNLVLNVKGALVDSVEKEFKKCIESLTEQKEKRLREIDEICKKGVEKHGIFNEIKNWKTILEIKLEDMKNARYNEDVLLQDINAINIEEGVGKLEDAFEKTFKRIKIVSDSRFMHNLNKFCCIDDGEPEKQ